MQRRNTTRNRTNNHIDIDHVCQHLTWLFDRATESFKTGAAVKGTKLYELQVEFCYFLNEIRMGHAYIVPKVIADCNSFIDGIVSNG